VLDAPRPQSAIVTDESVVQPDRNYPFSRRRYSSEELQEFLEAYVLAIDKLLRWLCEATNYVASDGQFDVDFALQTYQTVYLLLNTSVQIVTEQRNHFARKLGLFDVLEQYAALVDCRLASSGQTTAWKMHLEKPTVAQIQTKLAASYPGRIGDDFKAATEDIFLQNARVIEQGLIYGKNADQTVTVPTKGRLSFDDYTVSLLRGLRNTKHGFAIRDQYVLSVHTGAFGNDMPDYVLSLWFRFVADQTAYHLMH